MTLKQLLVTYDALKDAMDTYEDEAGKARSMGLYMLTSYYGRKFDAAADALENVRDELITKYRYDPEII